MTTTKRKDWMDDDVAADFEGREFDANVFEHEPENTVQFVGPKTKPVVPKDA